MGKGELGYSSQRDMSDDIESALEEYDGRMPLRDMAEELGEAASDLRRFIEEEMPDVRIAGGVVTRCE